MLNNEMIQYKFPDKGGSSAPIILAILGQTPNSQKNQVFAQGFLQ
jgi:hypothetical protein